MRGFGPALFCLLFSGCVFTPAGLLPGALLQPSVGSDTSPPNSTFFYIDLDEEYYDRQGVEAPLYEISTTEEYGDALERDSVSNCEIEHIAIDDTSQESESKTCILDVMEQELFLSSLPLVYNVPANMCTNVYVTIPWHYNYQAGRGPLAVTECTETRGSGEDEEEETFFCALGGIAQGVNRFAFRKTIGGNFDCNNNLETSANAFCSDLELPNGCLGTGLRCAEEEEDLCAFNYSSPDGEGQISCCFGNYYVDGEAKRWQSGELTDCLGGPGRTSWDTRDQDGFPTGHSHYVLEDGLRETIEIASIESTLGVHGSGSIPVANYLKILDQAPEDLREVDRAADLPGFYRTPAGAPRLSYRPNLFFAVQCLDQAGEILHELRLAIREWNTYANFARFYASGGEEEEDPDVPELGTSSDKRGEEGEDCEYENRKVISEFTSAVELCNDFLDFNDYIGSDEGAPANLFPRLDYVGG